MYTLEDCFPQHKEPPKLQLGMVLSKNDGVPFILMSFRTRSCGDRIIQLVTLQGHNSWISHDVTTFDQSGSRILSKEQIRHALELSHLREWRIWSAQEVADWFLKNYPDWV